MLDFDKILNFVKRWCLDKNEDKLLVLLREIRDTMMAYIGGVLCVSLLLMISSTIFLTILKVDFALLFSFADSIIEYITAFAFAPSTLSANNQFFLCTANGLIDLSAKLFVNGIRPSFKNSLSSFL